MQPLGSSGPTIRNQLKTKRDVLLKQFRENPSQTRLAIEIKLIDETIAQTDQGFRSKELRLRQLWEACGQAQKLPTCLVNAVVSIGRCNTQANPTYIENKGGNRSLGGINENAALARF